MKLAKCRKRVFKAYDKIPSVCSVHMYGATKIYTEIAPLKMRTDQKMDVRPNAGLNGPRRAAGILGPARPKSQIGKGRA